MGSDDPNQPEWKRQLGDEVNHLKRVRDELKVKMHLARADIRDAWGDLEERWPKLEIALKRFEGRTSQALDDFGEAVVALFNELKHGYRRIKDELKDDT